MSFRFIHVYLNRKLMITYFQLHKIYFLIENKSIELCYES